MYVLKSLMRRRILSTEARPRGRTSTKADQGLHFKISAGSRSRNGMTVNLTERERIKKIYMSLNITVYPPQLI